MILIDKHFPRDHKFYKLLNRNDVQVSYSRLLSMKNVTQKNNLKIIQDSNPTKNRLPLNQDCSFECLVYNAVVKT